MKRFSFLLSVALVTFTVGVTAALCSTRIRQLWPAEQEFARHTQLKLLRLEKVGERYEMQFQIVNGSSEPLRYRSYAKDDHCAFFLWRPREGTKQMSCGCGNGLAERTFYRGGGEFPNRLASRVGRRAIGIRFPCRRRAA